MIHNLYKERGETPLECIQRFIEKYPEYKKDKFTYLGRLDPLAEGVLLVGSGEEDTKQKRREEFFGLDKEYEFVALFGFATDTYDVLGKILRVEKIEKLDEMDLIKVCKVSEGEKEQEYPEYSSKMIASRKSFSSEKSSGRSFGLNQTFSTENFSEKKKINIYKLEFKKLDTLSHKELFGRLLMDISKVKGDFRQNEILILWKQILFPSPDQGEGRVGFLAKFDAHVSSGTYIRGIVNDMGKTLGLGATTLSIKRNRVGDHKIEDSFRFLL